MRAKLIVVLLAFTVILLVGGLSICSLIDVPVTTAEIVSIPLFLTAFELVVIALIPSYFKNENNSATTFLSATKIGKIVASIIFVLVWFWLGETNTSFFISYLIFYMLYIIYDSWMFMSCNRVYGQKQIKE